MGCMLIAGVFTDISVSEKTPSRRLVHSDDDSPLGRADRRTIKAPSTGKGPESLLDEQQTQRINEAAKKFSEALANSYRALTNHAVCTQEQGAQLTQEFFEAVIENLCAQAEGNQEMAQELVDQQQQQRKAAQALAQESALRLRKRSERSTKRKIQIGSVCYY